MHPAQLIVLACAAAAVAAGLLLRRNPRDTLPGKLMGAVLAVAGVVAALTGAIVPGFVLVAAGGIAGARALAPR